MADAITVSITVGGARVRALVDSGSRVDIVSRSLAERCDRAVSSAKGRLIMKFANGQTDKDIGMTEPIEISMSSTRGVLTEKRPFFVADICYDVILGLPWMTFWNASLCYSGPGVLLRQKKRQFYLPATVIATRQANALKVHQMAVELRRDLETDIVPVDREDLTPAVSCVLVDANEAMKQLDECDCICVAVVTEANSTNDVVDGPGNSPGTAALLRHYSDVFPEELPAGVAPTLQDPHGHSAGTGRTSSALSAETDESTGTAGNWPLDRRLPAQRPD